MIVLVPAVPLLIAAPQATATITIGASIVVTPVGQEVPGEPVYETVEARTELRRRDGLEVWFPALPPSRVWHAPQWWSGECMFRDCSRSPRHKRGRDGDADLTDRLAQWLRRR